MATRMTWHHSAPGHQLSLHLRNHEWRKVFTLVWVTTTTHQEMPQGMTSRTHFNSSPLDKMDAILAEDNFKCIFLNENDRIPFRISLKFVPRSPIVNTPALVHVMAWRPTGNKPLPELMLTQFTEAYIYI